MLDVVIVQFRYENLGRQLYKNTEKEISILKLTRCITDNINELGKIIIIANGRLFISWLEELKNIAPMMSGMTERIMNNNSKNYFKLTRMASGGAPKKEKLSASGIFSGM